MKILCHADPVAHGYKKVRVDIGALDRPLDERCYVHVKTGSGEADRIASARQQVQLWAKVNVRRYTTEPSSLVTEDEVELCRRVLGVVQPAAHVTRPRYPGVADIGVGSIPLSGASGRVSLVPLKVKS
jgi:hypothetical protein